MSLTLLIGGDVLPTKLTREAFACGNGEELLKDGLYQRWMKADVRLFNLECPITDRETPIEKCGPALKASPDAVRGIEALKPEGVCLCNNHILDYGPEGLRDTMEGLRGKGISTFGAGACLGDADRAWYREAKGIRLGVYAVTEHEFSTADAETPGANPLDPLELGDRVRQAKKDCDYLILLYHGGRECYPYPSPQLQKTCRKAASAGADLVLCQHSHCVGAQETFGNAVIVYGQGNFIFHVEDGEPCFDQGLLVEVTLGEGAPKVAYVPVGRRELGTALLSGPEGERLIGEFMARSRQIQTPGFVETTYGAYAREQKEKMMKVFFSGNPLLKAVNVLYGRRPSRVYGRQTQLNIKNTILCESLRELMGRGLE